MIDPLNLILFESLHKFSNFVYYDQLLRFLSEGLDVSRNVGALKNVTFSESAST
jgi:hypothetical protein